MTGRSLLWILLGYYTYTTTVGTSCIHVYLLTTAFPFSHARHDYLRLLTENQSLSSPDVHLHAVRVRSDHWLIRKHLVVSCKLTQRTRTDCCISILWTLLLCGRQVMVRLCGLCEMRHIQPRTITYSHTHSPLHTPAQTHAHNTATHTDMQTHTAVGPGGSVARRFVCRDSHLNEITREGGQVSGVVLLPFIAGDRRRGQPQIEREDNGGNGRRLKDRGKHFAVFQERCGGYVENNDRQVERPEEHRGQHRGR